MKNKLEYLLKHNSVIQFFYIVTMSTFFRFVGLFVRVNNKLILMNGHGYKYNDSPRTIYLKMCELGIRDNYEIVWAVNDVNVAIPGNPKIVKMDSWKYFITALRAKYWVSCVNIERGLKFKKRKTIYLNTWHGASLIFVGNAVGKRNDFHFEHINYFCYNGEYERDFIIRDFNVSPSALIKTGYPRNDRLYNANEEIKHSIRKKLNIPDDKKVILYAPTWRESNDGGINYLLKPPIDWKKWEAKLSGEYILFLRTHPYTTKLLNVEFNDFLQNYIEYPDVNDLLIVADILISDYSCILLDQAILGKPQFCYGYDYEEYISKRGSYIDMKTTLPNGVIEDENELLNRIINIDYDLECKKTLKFKENHMEYGGNATIRCIEYLFGTKIEKS